MQKYLSLLRPHHYIKNCFIFFPLFFAAQMADMELLFDSMLAFVAFSFSASSIYILNDYCDMEDDRKHPVKKNRPLASGSIQPKKAFFLMGLLIFLGSALMFFLSKQATGILYGYMALNVFYIFYGKHIAILDVSSIAIGFVLRLFIGSEVTSIPLSMWIVVMTFLLALFLALAKRRDDVLIYMETGQTMRKVIKGYNLQFLDSAMVMMASVVIVSYILYCTSSDVIQKLNTNYTYLTVFFVVLGIMRYLQIVFVEENSSSPTKIVIRDTFIRLTIFGWLLTFIWILYL